jgi:hypothetical protein
MVVGCRQRTSILAVTRARVSRLVTPRSTARCRVYAFTIEWYGSRDEAIGDAVTYIKIAQSIVPGQAYAPRYVAGNALMTPAAPTPWPPPERTVKAFGQAVGQPVLTITLPYGGNT